MSQILNSLKNLPSHEFQPHPFFNLSTTLQVSYIAQSLKQGANPKDFVDMSEHVLQMTAAAATQVISEIGVNVPQGLLGLKEITDLLPQSENSNPNAVSLELLNKARKTVLHAQLELRRRNPYKLAMRPAYLNKLQLDIQIKSNKNLEKIWSARLRQVLVRLENPEGLEIPDPTASAQTIQNFLNNQANASFLSQLLSLNLSSLQLTVLPKEIGQLIGMRSLVLKENQLIFIPEAIGNLTDLQWLLLDDNKIQKLPQTIGNLPNLQWLSLAHNQIRKLPPSIGHLINLETLAIDHNQLQELPKEMGNLFNLQWLFLSNNQLQELPDEFSNLTNLESLFLNDNQLHGFPEAMLGLPNLKKYSLGNNPIYL